MNDTMRRGTPNASTHSIARGRAASDDVVEKAMSAGSLMAFRNPAIGILNIIITGTSTSTKNTISAT